MAKPLYVGIDLGTTNSTAAVFDGEAIHLVRDAAGSSLTPSVVRIDGRGNTTVGARARRFLDSDPENTRAEFKRLMGTSQTLSFKAAKLVKRPEELAAEVLRTLRADIADQLGFAPERAVISVPALFELPQSTATSEAARLAGFERVELIQEPVASALAAGWSADRDGGGAWLVYDLGGGTFDASLLETRDGLLRVVGHDGDNFLGGRDIDQAIVDWALGALAETTGARVSRGDPAHAVGMRRLKAAAEEAKIELTRASEALLSVPGLFTVDGAPVDLDVVLDAGTLDRLVAPLVDRSIAVCSRLLAAHGLAPQQLVRILLVGGPTVMPALRQRVAAAFGVAFTQGLDPMTLVAQGAAVYAATAGLDARPAPAAPAGRRRLWLHYPAMSADLTPHVAGRLLEAGAGPVPKTVRLARDGWETPWVELSAEGALVVAVELAPRRTNVFRIEARDAKGAPVLVDPPEITIVQGMTITDPPLSRTVGVALASDRVHVYLERGTPLPAKRAFVHRTVEALARGHAESVLKIPIVQGEYDRAHHCRLVGTLEVGGAALTETLPSGSPIEVTIELDRGGRLSARALIPSTGQVFERVARLAVPDATVPALTEQIAEVRKRVARLREQAVRRGETDLQARLYALDWSIADATTDVEAARGGDADAGQKARRTLLDLDAALEGCEVDASWPELDFEARRVSAWALQMTANYGSGDEQRLVSEAVRATSQAREARQVVELQRQIRLLRELGSVAWLRHPSAWSHEFDYAASRIGSATDVRRAEQLVREGRAAQQRGDRDALRTLTHQLWDLLPDDAKSRQLGHDSGLR